MANIKVKFRKSTVRGKKGTIFYQVCCQGKSVQISTNIHVKPREWDKEQEKIKDCDGSGHLSHVINQKISNDVLTLRKIVNQMEYQHQSFTSKELRSRFICIPAQVSVFEYMNKQIKILQKKRKYGTATNYACALNSFSMYLENKDMTFGMIDAGVVMSYNDWLEERGIKRNSISFYMRIWRAVYNRAVRDNIIEQKHPFRYVYTGVDQTRKKAVDEDVVIKLIELDLRHNLSLDLARDMFVFSFCTRGMAFVDIAFLKKNNISKDMIIYTRRKTQQTMIVHIEACISRIIRKYNILTKGSPYVFPILTETDDNKAYKQYRKAIGRHNRYLKILADMAKIEENLTSYTSRHTWATTARNHNIPVSVISAGMGHTSERTTEIYLASLENSVIDEANKNVLKKINECISF